MTELIIRSGVHSGKRLRLNHNALVVGRDEDCQLRLNSSLVSRKHCILHVEQDVVWIEDLKSQNGTYVNDVVVGFDRQKLSHGDVLRIGANVFEIAYPHAASTAAPASVVSPSPPPAAASSTSLVAGSGIHSRPTASTKVKAPKVSDADISSWLTDEAEGKKGVLSSETVVIKGPIPHPPAKPSAATTIALQLPIQDGEAPLIKVMKPGQQKTVDLAAAIIRRHWEQRNGRHS